MEEEHESFWHVMAGVLVGVVLAACAQIVSAADFVVTDRETSSFVVTDRPTFEVITQPLPTATIRPAVYVTYADFKCPPCDAMKVQSWLGLPFDLVDLDQAPPKIAAQHYPWVHWQGVDGRWYYLENWHGKADLIQRWRATQKPVPKAQSPPVSRSYSPRWTWPGNLNRHLQDVHRVNTSGLNQDQLEALHDALHESGKKH